jgi:selenocysteine lyase/cysteine desulfurase
MDATRIPPQRASFDVPEDVAYLNCAYMSPQLRSVTAEGQAAVAVKGRPWTLTEEHWFGRVERARTLFGTLVGAKADDVALIPSASYGIATAAANTTVASGQTILLLADQFPSCVYPWTRKAGESGASVVTVSRPWDNDWTAAVLAELDERCAVVTLPQVHWTDGARLDLAKIAGRVREVGASLVLDLSQSAGADPIDVALVDPDWLCAPTYKWLLGPYSCGFLYVAQRNQQGRPLEENWIARAGSENFSKLVHYQDEYRGGARRYDMGERSNFALVPMMVAALEHVLGWGVERIAATLRATCSELEVIARKHGFEALPTDLRGPHILGLDRPGGLPDELIARLAERGVYVGRRGSSLRVAPHVHVTAADLQRFDAALGEVLD